MKTIGLLGGMSWESTELYYRWINQAVKQKLGGLHSAQVAMVSVDFQEIEILQHQGQWQQAGHMLTKAAQQIEAAGADFLLICTNTMHKVASQIEQGIHIPLLHIADATAAKIKQKQMKTVGLLGSKFTMAQDFYKGRLIEQQGLTVIVPTEEDQQTIHRIIYEELCLGIIKEDSRQTYLAIMERMRGQGAEGIIEGCTEIVMLVQQQHIKIPLFDTTAIHAEAAVAMAVADSDPSRL